MLVICEDCAKKYNIDENRIKGEKARFSCYECGHIIVVEKPKVVEPPPETPEPEPMTDEEAMAYLASLDSPDEPPANDSSNTFGQDRPGKSVSTLLLIAGVLVVCGILVYIYLLKFA